MQHRVSAGALGTELAAGHRRALRAAPGRCRRRRAKAPQAGGTPTGPITAPPARPPNATTSRQVLSDEILAPFFAAVNVAKLKSHQVNFMALAFGGKELVYDVSPWRVLGPQPLTSV